MAKIPGHQIGTTVSARLVKQAGVTSIGNTQGKLVSANILIMNLGFPDAQDVGPENLLNKPMHILKMTVVGGAIKPPDKVVPELENTLGIQREKPVLTPLPA